jgi:rSAM/selenodomain-associated transferase 1
MTPADFLLLVKDPSEGRVKRRLAEGIGGTHSAGLYRAFVLDLLSTFFSASIRPTICYHPASARQAIMAWLGPRYTYLAQRGSDHPDSLRRAFEDMFAAGAEKVVILASDNPDLPAGLLALASEALHCADAVLGPASDGGYYLVGFRRDALVLGAFRQLDWSTDHVFRQTSERIRDAGRSLSVLPVWHDIDNIGDLRELARRGANSDFARSRTMGYLLQNPGILHPGRGDAERE